MASPKAEAKVLLFIYFLHNIFTFSFEKIYNTQLFSYYNFYDNITHYFYIYLYITLYYI
jgi:hypothetical protein